MLIKPITLLFAIALICINFSSSAQSYAHQPVKAFYILANKVIVQRGKHLYVLIPGKNTAPGMQLLYHDGLWAEFSVDGQHYAGQRSGEQFNYRFPPNQREGLSGQLVYESESNDKEAAQEEPVDELTDDEYRFARADTREAAREKAEQASTSAAQLIQLLGNIGQSSNQPASQ